jgi:hypothetical protein
MLALASLPSPPPPNATVPAGLIGLTVADILRHFDAVVLGPRDSRTVLTWSACMTTSSPPPAPATTDENSDLHNPHRAC